MEVSKLIGIITILITLSVATERLVEIVKGFMPGLNKENLEPGDEAKRKAKVSILAIICGIVTAFLASPILAGIFKNLFPDGSSCKLDTLFNLGTSGVCGFDLSPNGFFLVIALGLLASGGSSLWNSILEYLLKVKDLKESQARKSEELRRIEVARATVDLDTAKARLSNPDKNN